MGSQKAVNAQDDCLEGFFRSLYTDRYHHVKNWIGAIRSRQPIVENPVSGFRGAGAALLSNVSYESGKPARWDPEEMKLL
jgi:hypothetical protein